MSPPFSSSSKHPEPSASTVDPIDVAALSSPSSVSTTNIIDLPNEPYPATDLVKYLIDTLGYNVRSFRRNNQVSCLLVDRARDIYDAINGYIQRTESGEDWVSFSKFTNAIDPIEEVLFRLMAVTEDEKKHHLTTGNTVEDCVAATENWATNREQIWEALGVLETRVELLYLFSELDLTSRQENRLEARRQDDQTFFEEIIRDITDTVKGFNELPGQVPGAIVEQLLTKMATGSTLPWLTVFIMKTGLLIQGMLQLYVRSRVSALIDQATRNHLSSRSVWKCAVELAELLNSTTSDDKASRDKVRLKYEAFSSLLCNTTAFTTPKSYIELMKQAGQVRRPFQAQAVALILLCRNLVTEFAKEPNRTTDNSLILEDTCNETLKALREVVAAVTELKIFDTVNLEHHPACRALGVAESHIKDCFSAFGLDDIWVEKKRLIAQAVKKDMDRMRELNKLLVSCPPQERAAQVKVTVTVCYQAEEDKGVMVVGNALVNVEGSARLHAVRWTVARDLDEQLGRRARHAGRFLLSRDSKPCNLNSSVSEITSEPGNECALKLIVRG